MVGRTEPTNSDADPPVLLGDRIARGLDNPWVVLGLLLFVFAAVGIPLVWISKAFSTWAKVLVTFLVIVYTGLILWLFWLVMLWSYQRVLRAL